MSEAKPAEVEQVPSDVEPQPASGPKTKVDEKVQEEAAEQREKSGGYD